VSILELQDMPAPEVESAGAELGAPSNLSVLTCQATEVTVSVLDLQDMPVPADDRDTAHGVPNTNLSISIC